MTKVSSLFNASQFHLDLVYRIENFSTRRSGYFQINEVNFDLPDTPPINDYDLIDNDVDLSLRRYFTRRYFLFSKFDNGIKLNNESWYSAIGQPIASNICDNLERAGVKSVFEPFCGAGGFASTALFRFPYFAANDIDPIKIDLLKNNLKVYGAEFQKVKIYNENALSIVPFKVDAVVLTPPWGGSEKVQNYGTEQIDSLMVPKLSDILNHYKQFSDNLVLQLPKTTNINNLFTVINKCDLNPVIRIQRILIDKRPSQLLVYIGKPSFTNLNCELNQIILKDTKKNIEDYSKAQEFIRRQIDQLKYDVFDYIFSVNTKM